MPYHSRVDHQFACVDGPDFDGHQVDWDELFQRRKQYMNAESFLSGRADARGTLKDGRKSYA